MKSVLLIDDCQDYRETIATILFENNFDVVTACSPKEAFELLNREDTMPDLILCDLHMPFSFEYDMKNYPYSTEVGVKTVQEFRFSFPEIPLIVITATAPHELKDVTKEIVEIPTLSKPFHHSELLQAIRGVLANGVLAIEH